MLNSMTRTYYSVGDSHASGVGGYGHRPGWVILSREGSPSSDPEHTVALNTIPTGSVTVISLGANDLKQSHDIDSIVSRVADFVKKAQSQGLRTVYLLPTNNSPPQSHKDALRAALLLAVPTPMIDLGPAGSDGVHLEQKQYAHIADRLEQWAQSLS